MKKNDDNRILEEDLCKPVSDFLVEQGYSVRSEVKYCDISAIKDDELVVVELKRNLSVELLTQAVKRQKAADSVYIAIPKPKRMTFTKKWNDICHLIRRLELGLILVNFKGNEAFVEIPIHPVPFDRVKSRNMNKKHRAKIIKEAQGRYSDQNVGGSTGKKLMTAYRENAIFIACCLDKFGPMSPKGLRELGTDPKKTSSILQNNHYKWFNRIKKGLYELTDAGREEMKLYPQIVDYYCRKIAK